MTAAFLALGLLIGSAAGFAVGAWKPQQSTSGIAPGDYVVYQLYGYGLDGVLVFTTDAELAEKEMAGGNEDMQVLFDTGQLGARKGVFEHPDYLTGSMDEVSLDRFFPTRYLAGTPAGATIHTPYYLHPFGAVPTIYLPSRIGPVSLTMTLNVDSAYSDENATESEEVFGPRSAIVDGATISYLGLLSSRVEFLEGGLARVSVVGADQAVLESEVFGLPLRLHDGGGDAWLEPVTSVGDTFLTQGCNIPGSVIPPGNYTVIAKSRDGYELQRHLGPFRALMTQPLRFDIVVHQVDKA